jgi:hypothetical protein
VAALGWSSSTAVELDQPSAATEPAAGPASPASTVPASTVPASTVPASTVPASTEPAGDGGDRRVWLPALVLAVVCLGFLGWGASASHGVWWAKSSSSVADERGPVLAAAKSCMAAMNTYDYRKLAQSEADGVACTTGTFTGQYKQAFEKLIKPQAAKVQFTQTAQINDAGVESVSGDGQQWVVLVYGQLSTTNSQTGTKAPTLTPFSARVTMQHVADKWLVANYQYAPSS